MAKFYGLIGFASLVEIEPDIWENEITDRPYYGDIIRNTRRLQTTNSVNDDVNITNEISIVSDPYADQNFLAIRYVEFMGAKWKVSTVDVQYPRLILTIGGVYNGEQARTEH